MVSSSFFTRDIIASSTICLLLLPFVISMAVTDPDSSLSSVPDRIQKPGQLLQFRSSPTSAPQSLMSLPMVGKENKPTSKQRNKNNLILSPNSIRSGLFFRREARDHRLYDVPQVECPPSDDGMDRFACPSADSLGRYRCIADHSLCDGFIDCPKGEDEDRMSCMFYKTTKAHLDVLADALLRWAKRRY